ncbi:MAG: HAMP domain-containing protein [Bdellovibrionales bacterium]|nr:HAMP domain-containing protein [Bdellovibrionales bacterium]
MGFHLHDGTQIFSSLKDSKLTGEDEGLMVKEAGEKSEGGVFTLKGKEEYIAYPWSLKNSLGESVGTSVMFRSMTKELAFFNSLENLFLVIGLISGFLALFVSIFLSGTVTRAISSLIEGVGEVKKGNLDYEVKVQTKDEFKSLADAFNSMTQGLKEKEMIKSTFKRYVNPKIVDSLLAEGEKLNLGGERRDVVIFFSDIASFTKISEKLTPEDTVQFLNRYLGAMTEVIEEREGIVDKYIGDAILAYWVITKKNRSGYEKACQVAMRQQEIVEELRAEWKDSDELKNFSMRIGIHGGQALMGNIGSTTRMDYTVIGDDVNTAARLESVNKLYGTNIIISQSIQQEISENLNRRELDSVYVVGKSEPVSIYELNENQELSKSFEKAFSIYKQGNFVDAKELFVKHKAQFEEDHASHVFIERCDELIKNPPQAWNGTYKLNSK